MRADVRAQLRAMLGPGVAVDWEKSDPAAPLPRVVLTKVSHVARYGQAQAIRLATARVQIDCIGGHFAEAVGLAEDVRRALSGWRGGAVRRVFVEAERDMGASTDSGVALSVVAVDVMVHYQE